MAWRTSEPDVESIVEVDSAINIAPFINTANALTDYVATSDEGSLLNTALLKQIESYLAAHFYSHRDKLYQEKKTGDASAVFQGKTDMGLDSTEYGQTAQVLDVTGTLRSLSKGGKARVEWLGLAPSDQTDYEDRD